MCLFICKPSTPIVVNFTPCSFYAFGCETRTFKSNPSTCWETIWMIGLSHSLLNFQWTDDFINEMWQLWFKCSWTYACTVHTTNSLNILFFSPFFLDLWTCYNFFNYFLFILDTLKNIYLQLGYATKIRKWRLFILYIKQQPDSVTPCNASNKSWSRKGHDLSLA